MESLYLLIPFARLLVVVVAVFLFWSVRQGQFDDMEGPAHSILLDDDSAEQPAVLDESAKLDPDQSSGVRQNVASDCH